MRAAAKTAHRFQHLRRLLCTSTSTGLSESERYLFDLNGFIILRGVLNPEEVQECNSAITAQHDAFQERGTGMRNSHEGAFKGEQEESGRLELGVFELESTAFNTMLAHPVVAPKLMDLVGEGYRLDHQPLIFLQRPGVEVAPFLASPPWDPFLTSLVLLYQGFDLHGGNIARSGAWNRELAYEQRYGQLYCNLLAMAVQLTDTQAGKQHLMPIVSVLTET
jgi:hypothetical protein